jgi:ribosomal protein L4
VQASSSGLADLRGRKKALFPCCHARRGTAMHALPRTSARWRRAHVVASSTGCFLTLAHGRSGTAALLARGRCSRCKRWRSGHEHARRPRLYARDAARPHRDSVPT